MQCQGQATDNEVSEQTAVVERADWVGVKSCNSPASAQKKAEEAGHGTALRAEACGGANAGRGAGGVPFAMMAWVCRRLSVLARQWCR